MLLGYDKIFINIQDLPRASLKIIRRAYSPDHKNSNTINPTVVANPEYHMLP